MFIYCENTRMPATPILTRYRRPPSVTSTHHRPPFRRAVATAGASSIPSGYSLLAISRQPLSFGADTCHVNCGHRRVTPGVELCRATPRLPSPAVPLPPSVPSSPGAGLCSSSAGPTHPVGLSSGDPEGSP